MLNKSLLTLLSLCCGVLAAGEIPAVNAGRLPETYRIEQTDKKVWDAMEWHELSGSFPHKAKTQGEKDDYQSVTGYPYPDLQFAQKSLVAAAWNRQGLFFRFTIEDGDVQGNKNINNDWIWLEDVAEILIAAAGTRQPDLELQVNPAGATFVNFQRDINNTLPEKAGGILDFKTVVAVDGSLNRSGERDRGWSAEFFLPWKMLAAVGMTPPGFLLEAGRRDVKVKFATWDLSAYFLTRVNRYLEPGSLSLHDQQHFNPLILK